MLCCDTPNLITKEMRNASVLSVSNDYRNNLIAIINVKDRKPSLCHKIIVYGKDKIWFPVFREISSTIKKQGLKERLASRPSDKRSLNRIYAYMLRRSLKHKNKKYTWENVLGYTSADLRAYFEKKFTQGMTWRKFHKGEIHIDHIIPVSVFNYEKIEDDDFHKCWALKNLQPLWAKDNRTKRAKIKKHIQPSLIFDPIKRP